MEHFTFDKPYSDPNKPYSEPNKPCPVRSTTSTIIQGLFGPGAPSVPIFGSPAAIEELKLASTRDSLFVQPHDAHPEACISIAYWHLQRQGVFPDDEQIAELSRLGGLGDPAAGIAPEDYILREDNVVTSPPFKSLDVDKVLGALRVTAKHFSRYCEVVLGEPQYPIYQLGVVTLILKEDDAMSFKAELFPSRTDINPTSTAWLYRWCVSDGAGGYTEHWQAFDNGSFDLSRLSGATPAASQLLTPQTKSTKRRRVINESDNEFGTGLPMPRAPTKKARFSATAEPPDYLFQENPQGITGKTILNLARWYSNQELFERINAGLAAKGLALVETPNVTCRRITVAINSQAAAHKNMTRDELRRDLDHARAANGVRARMNIKTQALKEANKAAKARAQTSGSSYGEDDG